MVDVQPGPVSERVVADLARLRVPDLSGFRRSQVTAELEEMFDKSGLLPEWLAWMQETINMVSLGLVTMETARHQDLPSSSFMDATQLLFVDVQRLRTPFRDQLVVISRNEPHFHFVEGP